MLQDSILVYDKMVIKLETLNYQSGAAATRVYLYWHIELRSNPTS